MKKQTKIRSVLLLTLAGMLATSSSSFAKDEEKAPAVDPMAVKIIKRAADHLTAAKQFSVSAEIWQDLEEEDGTMLQFTKLGEIKVRRPDGFRIDIKTDVPKRSFYYDGKSVSVMDHQKGFYANAAAPATIDKTLDAIDEKFDLTMPLEDLLASKPFGDAAKKAKSGQYLGKESVLGKLCHHVAFQGEHVDWQVWINGGAVPTIRKIVISFIEEEGAPQFTAIFSKWNTTTVLPDYVFTHDPPAGAVKIEMMPAQKEAESAK